MTRILAASALLSGALSAAPQLTFKDSYVRYLSGHDVLRVLAQKFPHADHAKLAGCNALDDKNRALLGENNPSNGEVTYRGPSAAFVKWYSRCLVKITSADVEGALAKKDLENHFGAEALKLLPDPQKAALLADPKSVPWAPLPLEFRSAVVRHGIRRLIGMGIAKDEAELQRKLEGGMDRLENRTTSLEALKKLAFFLATDDAFLTY